MVSTGILHNARCFVLVMLPNGVLLWAGTRLLPLSLKVWYNHLIYLRQRWGESHIHSVAESRRLVQDGAADIASLAPEQLC